MPTAHAKAYNGSEGSVSKVSTRRAFGCLQFGYLQIGTGPSAFAVGELRNAKCKKKARSSEARRCARRAANSSVALADTGPLLPTATAAPQAGHSRE